MKIVIAVISIISLIVIYIKYQKMHQKQKHLVKCNQQPSLNQNQEATNNVPEQKLATPQKDPRIVPQNTLLYTKSLQIPWFQLQQALKIQNKENQFQTTLETKARLCSVVYNLYAMCQNCFLLHLDTKLHQIFKKIQDILKSFDSHYDEQTDEFAGELPPDCVIQVIEAYNDFLLSQEKK